MKFFVDTADDTAIEVPPRQTRQWDIGTRSSQRPARSLLRLKQGRAAKTGATAMASFRNWFWAIPMIAATPAPALAQEPVDLCAAVQRILTSAREPVPFASLAEAPGPPALLPGFEAGNCQVTAGTEIACSRIGASANLDLDVFAPALGRCLGIAPVLSRSRRPSILRSRELVVVTSGVRFEAANGCSAHCRAGLLAYFRVSLENPRRPE